MDSVQGVLIKDDILNASSDIKFGIYRGPASFNPYTQVANSASSSSASFVYNVPSQDLFVSKAVYLKQNLRITINGNFPPGTAAGTPGFKYGIDSAVCPWGIIGAISNANLKINNTTISADIQNTLQVLLKMYDTRALSAHNSTAPYMPDALFFEYGDAQGSLYNPLSGINGAGDPDMMPRGAFPYVSLTSRVGAGAAALGVPVATGAAGDVTFVSELVILCTSPIPVSPLIWDGDLSQNRNGMYGLNTISLQLQFNAGAKLFRTSSPFVTSCALGNMQAADLSLLFDVVQPHADSVYSSVNIHNYMDNSVKVDNVSVAVPAATGAGVGDGTITPNKQSISASTSITLNNLFDKVAFFVRPSIASQTCKSADNSLVISGFSISLGNYSGLLSQADKSQLFHYAREAGSNQVWSDWQGSANRFNNSTNTPAMIPTNGNIIVLDLGKHIALADPSLAPGSILNSSFQLFNVAIENYSQTAFAAGSLELVMIFFSSGALRIDRGVASTYLGLLSKEMVLNAVSDANQGNVQYASDVKRMVGGGLLSTMKTIGKFALPLVEKYALPAAMNYAKSKLGGAGPSGGAKNKLSKHFVA